MAEAEIESNWYPLQYIGVGHDLVARRPVVFEDSRRWGSVRIRTMLTAAAVPEAGVAVKFRLLSSEGTDIHEKHYRSKRFTELRLMAAKSSDTSKYVNSVWHY